MANVFNFDVNFTDNTEAVQDAFNEQLEMWLTAIGEDAAGTAADVAPVDTGRLKNSINWATETAYGDGDTPLAQPERKSVYIGTNVEYAIYQELGTSRGIAGKHFIQFGSTAHQSEYAVLLEQYLKQ